MDEFWRDLTTVDMLALYVVAYFLGDILWKCRKALIKYLKED